MKVEGNWRQINMCLCKLVKWDFILWIRALYPRLVQGHQGYLVASNFASKILDIMYFVWRRFMTFIVFSMGFVTKSSVPQLWLRP